MKRIVLSFGLIILFAAVLGQFLPWWIYVVPAFLVSYLFKLSGKLGFWISFSSILILFLITIIIINSRNNSMLSEKIGEMLGGLSPTSLIIISSLIAALLSGLSGWVGGRFGRNARS